MIDTIGWPVMIRQCSTCPFLQAWSDLSGRLKVLRGHRSVCQKENDYSRESLIDPFSVQDFHLNASELLISFDDGSKVPVAIAECNNPLLQ